MTRPVQYFSKEYLESCKKMSALEIARFLEDFRLMFASQKSKSPQKLISLSVPKELLSAFQNQCKLENVPYQTKIKSLMKDWLTRQ